jgi:hypothetical protein
VAVIAALLVAADLTARSVAATELSRRLRAAVPETAGGAVHVRSFPFLPLLLTSGRVPEVEADVRDVIVKRVRFDFIAVELHGVQLDRDQLLRDRTIVLQAIERGEVRGEVGQDSLADALGVPVTLEAGKASVEIAGRTVSARLSIADGRLEVSGLGITLPSLDLTGPLLPCLADAVILSGRVALSCDFTEIPEELRA